VRQIREEEELMSSDIEKDIGISIMTHSYEWVKKEQERRRVARMTPSELDAWRANERAKIHKRAVEYHAEAPLFRFFRKLWGSPAPKEVGSDAIRFTEVILLVWRGVEMNQYLLEGVDIRGLDLSRLILNQRECGPYQDHINRAIGDETTLLPDYWKRPESWSKSI
jgi:hypothetical protein